MNITITPEQYEEHKEFFDGLIKHFPYEDVIKATDKMSVQDVYLYVEQVMERYNLYDVKRQGYTTWLNYNERVYSDLTYYINACIVSVKLLNKYKTEEPAERLIRFVDEYPRYYKVEEEFKYPIPKVLIKGLTEHDVVAYDSCELRQLEHRSDEKLHWDKPLTEVPAPTIEQLIKYVKDPKLQTVIRHSTFFIPVMRLCGEIMKVLHMPLLHWFVRAHPQMELTSTIGKYKVLAEKHRATVLFECYLLACAGAEPYKESDRTAFKKTGEITMLKFIDGYQSCELTELINAQDHDFMKAYLTNLYSNAHWKYGLMKGSELSDYAWMTFLKNKVGHLADHINRDEICLIGANDTDTERIRDILSNCGIVCWEFGNRVNSRRWWEGGRTEKLREPLLFGGIPVSPEDDQRFIDDYIDTLKSNLSLFMKSIGMEYIDVDAIVHDYIASSDGKDSIFRVMPQREDMKKKMTHVEGLSDVIKKLKADNELAGYFF